MRQLKHRIGDTDNTFADIKIELGPYGVEIGAVGYGEKTAEVDHGFPIWLEVHQGRLRLVVWADFGSEEPTHIIDLEGARESGRQDGGK